MNRWAFCALAGLSCCVGTLVFGCGDVGSSANGDEFGNGGGVGFGGSGGSIIPPAGSGGSTPLPPEKELEPSYGFPVATGRYVWIANPTSGRVAYIDAATLEIELVDAGNGPTQLAAVPHPTDDVAIVLNALSLDATLLRADANGDLSTMAFAVPSGGNRWAIANQGRWATAWTDARDIVGADAFDGFQDITVLDLDDESATPLTVGYRPVALGYDDAGTRLFAITADGISVVALDGPAPSVVKNVPLAGNVASRDVAITPDGAWALVRNTNVATLTIVSLTDDSVVDLTLPAIATDMDLAPDGSLAVAVLREAGQVALLDLPAIASDPNAMTIVDVPGAKVGSVALASGSAQAFLYTNAEPSTVLTVLDTSAPAPAPSQLSLHAAIDAVFPTPGASHAVVLHGSVSGSSSYAAAVSLVPVSSQLPSKIVGLEQPVAALALAPAGNRAIIATGSDTSSSFELVLAKLPSLAISRHALASRPIAAGVVAGANRGFVVQEHPDGRITFVDLDDSEVRTLTGFELATQVVTGSQP